MTNEPNKPGRRRAAPRRAARPERAPKPERAAAPGRRARDRAAGQPDALAGVLAWARTTPGMLVLGVVVLALAFVVRVAVTGDEKKPEAKPDLPGTANASYGNEWKTADGSRYEISVETLTDLVTVGSPDTCVAAPTSPSMTNLHFTVKIKNKGKKAAPVPEVRFGTNVQPSGAIDPTGLTFAKANKDLQVTPLARAQNCKEGARLGPENREEIGAGQTEVFTGTFGPTKLPITDGITVLVRYFEGADKTPTDLLAPFGDFGG